MAGGGEVGGHEPKKHGNAKKRKKVHRVGLRIDMTPLVDIAFLLLTFFMMTTSMSRPQTMEINLPPEEVKVEIAESNLLTIRVDNSGDIFWNLALDAPEKIGFSQLRSFLREKITSNPKLVTVIKIDREGKYSMMVNMIDELNLASITRFSLAPLGDKDKEILAKAKSS